MAAKKSEQATVEQKQGEERKPGAGQKKCPACGEIMGTRRGKCTKCGHKFKPSAKVTDPLEWVADVQAKVTTLGGIDQLRSHIHAVEESEKKLESLGGIEDAKKVLAVLEAMKQL